MLTHGGQLATIAQQFQLDITDWLDLSTGISPFSYSIAAIPQVVWRQLPQISQGFIAAVSHYYETEHWLACNGSQAAIQALPLYFKARAIPIQRVYLPQVGYQEHFHAWHTAGFQVQHYRQFPTADELLPNSVVVLINPNNPTTELVERSIISTLCDQLTKQNAWLIIDEAFMDAYPKEASFMQSTLPSRCIILRSVGKFFGLAGVRLGFVMANRNILNGLAAMLGPWSVNGLALHVAEQALADVVWQVSQRSKLILYRDRLVDILSDWFALDCIASTPLFVTVSTLHAEKIFAALCRQKIYTRLCDEKNAIRWGIPDEAGLLRLTQFNWKALMAETFEEGTLNE